MKALPYDPGPRSSLTMMSLNPSVLTSPAEATETPYPEPASPEAKIMSTLLSITPEPKKAKALPVYPE